MFFFSLTDAQESQNLQNMAFWSLILIGMLVVLALVVNYIRKWMKGAESSPSAGFTLSDLRRLHREGQLSDEEFEKAKALIVAGAKAAMARADAQRKLKSSEGVRRNVVLMQDRPADKAEADQDADPADSASENHDPATDEHRKEDDENASAAP